MSGPITFTPSPEEERIIHSALGRGECTTDVIRRALRLLEQERWLVQARMDTWSLAADAARQEQTPDDTPFP